MIVEKKRTKEVEDFCSTQKLSDLSIIIEKLRGKINKKFKTFERPKIKKMIKIKRKRKRKMEIINSNCPIEGRKVCFQKSKKCLSSFNYSKIILLLLLLSPLLILIVPFEFRNNLLINSLPTTKSFISSITPSLSTLALTNSQIFNKQQQQQQTPTTNRILNFDNNLNSSSSSSSSVLPIVNSDRTTTTTHFMPSRKSLKSTLRRESSLRDKISIEDVVDDDGELSKNDGVQSDQGVLYPTQQPELISFVHLALVSVKGSLAFWRSIDLVTTTNHGGEQLSPPSSSSSSSLLSYPPSISSGNGFFTTSIWNSNGNNNNNFVQGKNLIEGSAAAIRPQQQQQQSINNVGSNGNIGSKCSAQNLAKLSLGIINGNNYFRLSNSNNNNNNNENNEIVAVEGTSSIKLNFVIIIGRQEPLKEQSGQISSNSDENKQQQQLAKQQLQIPISISSGGGQQQQRRHRPEVSEQEVPSDDNRKLKLYWTKNGQQLLVNSPKSRFNQQLINENDIIRQYFSSSSSSSSLSKNDNNTIKHESDVNFSFKNSENLLSSFMLAPYINDQLMSLIENQSQSINNNNNNNNNNRDLRTTILNNLNLFKRTTSSPLKDDFLSDGQSIDWRKLEAYLRYYLTQLNSQFNNIENQNFIDCFTKQNNNNNNNIFEQLTIVQLELNHLIQNDRGFYQLSICNQNSCQQISFNLRILEDIPRWENNINNNNNNNKILDVGDRLSIKCEATGFTLPQITWFLDGQQLNEHQTPSTTTTTAIATTSSSTQKQFQLQTLNLNNQLDNINNFSRLRIGDYVTQDNHVHSFVNSSQIQLGDGGFYKCQANNGFHLIEQEFRIDVRGPPTISRLLQNISVLNDQNQLHIQCPYSGYPINSIEWYYRPSSMELINENKLFPSPPALNSLNELDENEELSRFKFKLATSKQFRLKRVPKHNNNNNNNDNDNDYDNNNNNNKFFIMNEDDLIENLDSDKDFDPDKDEWLSQASAMTTTTPKDNNNNNGDYPEQIPDYPIQQGGDGELFSIMREKQQQQQQQLLDEQSYEDDYPSILDNNNNNNNNADYWQLPNIVDSQHYGEEMPINLQQNHQQQQQQQQKRRRRDTSGVNDPIEQANLFKESVWIKFPQGRRHQVHQNGTLIIHDVNHSDQGYYKCKALGSSTLTAAQTSSSHSLIINNQVIIADHNSMIDNNKDTNNNNILFATSNEFYLTVLVPPVISPFSSSESLREGMRNFLTCSVIEGDSPVHLSWFKDDQPIEEYINYVNKESLQSQLLNNNNNNNNNNVDLALKQPTQRIRIDASNEYTSTLYFSHVDFKDNGNYTCMASNKAASVNYTAKMLVNVPPKWIKIPKDIECVSGQNIVIDCQAQAHPNPRVWWEIGVYNPQQQTAATGTNIASLTSSALLQSNGVSSPILADQNSQKIIKLNGAGGGGGDSSLSVAPSGSFNLQQQHHHHLQPPNHYRTIISNSRIHILENASLVIKEINKFDQGYYLCQAANNFGSLSSLIKLTVNVGASFANKYLIKYVKLNERVEFDCDPIGQSPVDVIWFQLLSTTTTTLNNNNTVNSLKNQHFYNLAQKQSNNNLLLLTNQSIHQGVSKTIINNDGFKQKLFTGTIRTDLQHQQLSSTTTTTTPTTTSSSINFERQFNQHTFNDQSQQNKQMITALTNQDQLIEFDTIKRPSIDNNNNNDKSELVRLIIKQAKRYHSADYICQASNKYGSDEKVIKLLVQEPPESVEEINVVQLESRSISINWLPPFNGNSPITSYTIEWTQQQPQHSAIKWLHLITQQTSATITGLQPITSYEIRIRAQNQFGLSALPIVYRNNHNDDHHQTYNNHLSSILRPIIITTTEEAPSSPPNDIKAVALSSSSIQLSWLAPEELIITTNNNNFEQILNSTKTKYSIKGYYLGYKISNSNESYIFKTVSLFDNNDNNNNNNDNDNDNQDTNRLTLSTNGDQQVKLFAIPEKHLIQHYNNNHNHHHYHLHQYNESNSDDGKIRNQEKRLRVVINDLKRFTKYSIIVQAFNSAGPGPQSDQIEAKTLINDPPPAPLIRVGVVTYSSIEIQWTFQSTTTLQQNQNDNKLLLSANSLISSQTNSNETQQQSTTTAIDGYYLYYKLSDNDNKAEWIEKKLSPETHTIIRTAATTTNFDYNNNQLSIVELSTLQDNNRFFNKNIDNNNKLPKPQPQQQQLSQQPTNTRSSPSSIDNNNNNNIKQLLDLQDLGWFTSTDNININNNNKTNSSDNLLLSLSNKSFKFILDQLICGTKYQIYMIAYNSIGTGFNSQIIKTKTRGSSPIAPRKQDFLSNVNSTFVQLNLDSWMDGGCSISNFEIKYKQINNNLDNNRATTFGNNNFQTTTTMSINDNNKQSWILVSSSINPEQRMIELRDLKPETWYSVLTIAESIAGKTEQIFNFMTLDKFGQLPPEAIEPPSNLPSLFRNSNGSFMKSILMNSFFSSNNNGHNYNNNNNNGASLLLSGLICIIIVICSLLLWRKFSNNNNNNIKADNASIDSQTTSGAMSSANLFGHSKNKKTNNNNNHHHHHHHQLNSSPIILSSSTNSQNINSNNNNMINSIDYNKINGIYGLGAGNSSSQEYYSMKASPCKTSTTILTSSSASGSNGVNNTSGSSTNNNNCPLSESYLQQQEQEQQFYYQQQQLVDQENQNNSCFQMHSNQINQQIGMEPFCSSTDCQAHNHHNRISPLNGLNNKFATLASRESHQMNMPPLDNQQQSIILNQHNRFKTMPHSMNGNQSRPISTFMPNNQQQQQQPTARFVFQQQQSPTMCNDNQAQQQQSYADQQQQQQQQQQQIYSKLRLIYNSNSNYNLSSIDNNNLNQKQTSMEQTNSLYNNNNNNVLCTETSNNNNNNNNNNTSDAINLALMKVVAQQNPKLLATLKRVQNNGIHNTGSDNIYNQDNNLILTNYDDEQNINGSANAVELTSLLLDCEQQQQQQVNNSYGQYSTSVDQQQQQQQISATSTNNTNGFCNNSSSSYGGVTPSIASMTTTTSTTNSSTQQNNTSSGSFNGGSSISEQQQHHLLKIASNLINNNNSPITINQLCSNKSNQINIANKSIELLPNQNNKQSLANDEQQQQQMGLQIPSNNNNNNNNSNNGNSEQQSDYALPFPPKWV